MSVLCYRREKGPRYGLKDFVAFLPNLTCSYWITITVWWICSVVFYGEHMEKTLVCLLSQISWKKLANPCGLMGTAIKCIEISICLEWGFSSKLILSWTTLLEFFSGYLLDMFETILRVCCIAEKDVTLSLACSPPWLCLIS
jgi:hypothetical protein